MAIPWGAIAGAGIGGAFDLAGGLYSAKASRAESSTARKFQLYMASTAYQRTMEDMRKAGLNPILAYKQGGTSAPGGVSASIPNLAGIGSSAVARARELALLKSEIRTKDSQTRLNTDQAWAAREMVSRTASERYLNHQLAKESIARAANTKAMNARMRAEEHIYKQRPWLRYMKEFGLLGIPGAIGGEMKNLPPAPSWYQKPPKRGPRTGIEYDWKGRRR